MDAGPDDIIIIQLDTLVMPILTDSKNFIQNEFVNLSLGDKRLDRRAVKVAISINHMPSFSIPQMIAGNDGQLKGIYRFFQNKKINDQNIIESHYTNTLERMESYKGKILLLNDSCFVTPTKKMVGLLSRGKGKENCVRVHYCLAISEDGKHLFGIIDFKILSDPIQKRDPELRNESDIWIKVAENAVNLINSSPQPKKLLSRCLFIADREGDEFELMDFLKRNNLGFIIRSQYNRNIVFNEKNKNMLDVISKSKHHGSSYSIKTQKNKRIVEVDVKRSVLRNIEIIPPAIVKKTSQLLSLNMVIVEEINPDQKPVSWKLWTTEEIPNVAASKFIVDAYTHRWKIEEVNKAAKTGVRVEDRQFTELDHFLPFLSMAFVVAWRIVALRTVVEVAPETPIEEAFTEEELQYMKEDANQKEEQMITVQDALIFIGKLGGFTGRYERPGWIILWQGWMRFL